jgi:hypothetical protein
MQFVLNQFPRNSRYVSRLPCEDIPIFLEEFDKREFLFRIQIIAYVSNLGRLLVDNRIILLSVSSGWMDVLEVLASGIIGFRGDSTKAWFSSWSSAEVISLSAVSQFSLSQSKARLTSPLIEMMPRGPDIFKTK